jgi:transcriptional regulator with GAF, ATPase, and Fis domain/tetratricopeptide (TPR) repeat protein
VARDGGKSAIVVNDRYEILEELGGGAQGAVFRVRDRLFRDRPTALKLLGPKAPGALLRFEFEQLARLEHPNVVQVFELGLVDRVSATDGPAAGTAFFTQELVSGGPADNAIGELDAVERPAAVARIGVAVGRALMMLHARGLLHRDIKPSNILVGGDGEAIKLIDLGLARPTVLADGLRAGTVAYMAPEALQGFPGERSDLYALGATLFHLLGGKPPSPGVSPGGAPPPGAPAKLWSLVLRLTRPRADERLGSARETVLALGRAMGPKILGADRAGDLLDAASEAEDRDTRAARLRSAELVGRETAIDQLRGWLDQSLAGESPAAAVAVLAGPPGVGKSRLARKVVVDAQLAAAEAGRTVPEMLSGGLRQLVAALVGRGAPETELLRAWLRATEGAAVAEPANLAREIAGLLRAGSRPSVVLIEDADRGLAPELLAWLADGMGGAEATAPVAVIAEIRERELAQKAAEASDGLLIDLEPLELAEESRLIRGVLGRDPGERFLTDLHERTGGLPLLTEAVLAALTAVRPIERIEEGSLADVDLPGDPEALVVTGLLADTQGAGRALVEALAVLGRPASIEEAAAIGQIDDPADAQEAAGRLQLRGWLLTTADDLLVLPGFALRSLRESLPAARSRKLHRAALDMLAEDGAADPVELAGHAVRSGQKRRARDLCRRAADLLRAAGDLRGAAEQLELLLEVCNARVSGELRVELAHLYRSTGRYDRALELLDATKRGQGSALAERVALERAAILRLCGRVDKALDLLEELTRADDRSVALEARALAARTMLDRGELDRASAAIEDVGEETAEALLRSGLTATAGLIALARGDLLTAGRCFDAGLAAAAAAAEPQLRARFLALNGMLAHGAGRWRAAAERYAEALRIADETGDRHGGATYAVNLAAALTEIDDVAGALSGYREGLVRLRRVGRIGELAQAGASYAQLLLRLGDVAGARDAAQRALTDAERAAQDGARAYAACICGDVLISAGEPDKARTLLEEADEIYSRIGAKRDAAIARRHLAASQLALGAPAQAHEELGRAAEADGETAGLEHRRLETEVAMAGQGDLALALNGLLESLPRPGEPRGTVHLRAIATAARAAARLGLGTVASQAASDALGIIGSARQATPTLHRNTTDPLEAEMRSIGSDSGAQRSSHAGHPSGVSSAAWGWERLVRINTRLNSELRIGPLLDLIMDTAIDITSAERGFLLVADRKGKLRIRSARNIDRERLDRDERDYSRSVAVSAYETGEPIVATDAQDEEQFRGLHSVVALELRYILAVPLNVKGRATGTIYVDSRAGGRFDETRLALLRALADQAAIALTNARLSAENRRRQQRIARLNKKLEGQLRAREGELKQARRDLKQRTEDLATRYSYEGIIGRSREMAEVFRTLDRITATDLPVVIQGESGTGKELVARAIHFNGPRKAKPFVAENCAAIPETLLESVLFGHVRGAFTGAIRDSRGLFAEADGGTLFLDEVGDMPLPMQAKLLRVLQDGEVRPVGGNKAVKVDVRILVASNADLTALVASGAFREDLFYRLNVIPVRLPPLRKRQEDIPLLAEHFAAKHRPDDVPRMTQVALEALIDYPWPGNVRQLENELMRASVLCADVLDVEHLSEEVLGGASLISEAPESLEMEPQLNSLKRRLIQLALKRSRGNRTKAAEQLGVSRYGLQKMMTRLGL